jgi:hypothetical protein
LRQPDLTTSNAELDSHPLASPGDLMFGRYNTAQVRSSLASYLGVFLLEFGVGVQALACFEQPEG